MLFLYRMLAVPIFIAFVLLPTHAQRSDYPSAKSGDHVDTYHGIKVDDPYRWMEEPGSAELGAWIKSQGDLLQNFVGNNPSRSAIQKRITELVSYESYTTSKAFTTPYVAKRSSRYFFIRTDVGDTQPALYIQEDPGGKPRMLIDAKSLAKDKKFELNGFEPSPNGDRVVLFLAPEGGRWLTLKVLDVATGMETTDVLTDAHRLGGNVSWAADGKGFFYTKFGKLDNAGGGPAVPASPKIYFHALGDAQAKDTLIYEQANSEKVLLGYQATADGKYLVISSVEGAGPNNRIFYKELQNPKTPARSLFGEADANYTFLGNQGTRFWFYTNSKAPRGRVVYGDINDPGKTGWKEVVPEAKEVISGGSSVGGNALGMFGDRIVLLYMRDSNPVIKIFDTGGRLEKEVALPSGGTIWGGFSGSRNDSEILYQFLGLTSPGLFYRLDVASKQNQEFLRPKLKLDPADYETRQVFFQSKDGTRVPMFIAHRKGIKLDGGNPAYMYGYGAMNWVAFMWYQPHIITWLDMGGVYAVPGIRGGGEYGEEWHQAGVKQNKRNSVDDYIAAAEWLIKNKYTSAAKFVANGGSASSSVVAAGAVLKRPDLFGATVLDIPFLDMLRYDKFTNGRYYVSEFGTAEDAGDFNFLRSFSPYHNLEKGRCYPSTLVMVGERDEVALPFHGFKFTARMQNSQGCGNPVMLKVMRGAGHNQGETPEQRIDSWTDQVTFLSTVLKMPAEERLQAASPVSADKGVRH